MTQQTVDPYGDEGAKKNIEDAKERLRIKDRNRSDIDFLLKFPHFRRFYWRLLSECAVFSASFDLNQKLQDFKEGRRDVGKVFLDELNATDATAFYTMMREANSEKMSIKKNQ